jgi:hypothetical protein
VVPGDDEKSSFERLQQARCAFVLLGSVAMGEVAARHHELRFRLLDERAQIALDFRLLACARV